MSESPDPNWILGLRVLPFLAWVLGVLIVVVALALSGPVKQPAPSHDPVAARDMDANHIIAPADLRTPETMALVSHFFLQPVKAGKPVTPSMVSARKAPSTRFNTIAAIITVPAGLLQKGIDVGSFVAIFRGAVPFGPPGRVMAIDCDDQDCSVIVGLPKIANRTIDPDSLEGATLERVAAPVPDVRAP